jgi:putative iron-dependent peroxidase
MSLDAHAQPAILAPVPALARYLTFDLVPGADPRPALARLRDAFVPAQSALGFGQPLVLALGRTIDGLRAFPALAGPGCAFPSTQGALWAFLGGGDASDLFDRARTLAAGLGGAFVLREEIQAFRYRGGRDLSDYEDGTESPTGERGIAAALSAGRGESLDGGSFVAVQRWAHDLAYMASLREEQRDHVIGRRHSDNTEIEDAPAAAHVKRAAQETYDPPAFMVRRSMPYGGVADHGLYFVAYGESLDRFERVLRRMAGLEDGIVDALLTFSRAKTGEYYWCPPVKGERLDLRALGL